MMGDLPESVASGSNTFSPKIGSAGAYESDTLWSAGIATDFSTGIGKSFADNGIYYAEVDTRRPDAILPPLARTGRLNILDIATDDTGALGEHCHFVEVDDRLFLAIGVSLYEWRDETSSFLYKFNLGIYTTSIAYFDGYLHVAGWRNGAPGERDYLWIRVDDFSYGFDTTAATGVVKPSIFHVFGGILYAAQGNAIYYTAGSQQDTEDDSYPPAPWHWEWVGPIRIGTYNDDITGIAGIIYQQLGQRYVYVSTRSGLSVVLPGDIPFGVTAWPLRDRRNGVGMKTFYNRIYIPVGGDLFALQSNGDLIASGVDSSPDGLPTQVSGSHFDIATSANLPFVTLRADQGYDTIWAGKASSWHFMGKLPVGEVVMGSYYSNTYGRLFMVAQSGLYTHWYLGDTNRPARYNAAYRYARLGVVDVGRYVGALFEQPKYWHSAFVDAGCLSDKVSVELVYVTGEEDCYNLRSDYEDWHSLGFISDAQQELSFGYELASRSVRVAAILRSEDSTVTPSLRAIGIRYSPKIVDRNRWSITVKLPKWELYDARGAQIEDYDQDTWDTHLGQLRKRETPVRFRDLDGQEYWVLVTGASRRIYSVGNDDELTYDVDWSFALTEVAAL